MPPKTSHTSSQAFDLLHDEVEARLSILQADIAETAKRGAYDKVGQLAKTAQELADLKKELAGVEKRYNRLIEADEPDEPAKNLSENSIACPDCPKGVSKDARLLGSMTPSTGSGGVQRRYSDRF